MSERIIETFQRVEDKYVISEEQAEMFLDRCEGYLKEDLYFQYTVHSLYYDSENNDLMIQGLNKPKYKAKIRFRSYGAPGENHPVFIETKKKYGNIVYKRRITLGLSEAENYLEYGIPHSVHNNTADEIDYLMNKYNPEGKALILYDRTCYAGVNEADVRITFDRNIRYRTKDVNLYETGNEIPLNEGKVVMEIKVMDRYPLWMTRVLSEMKLYQGSFSKYGTIYAKEIAPKTEKRNSLEMVPVYVREKENSLCSLQY